MIDLESLFNLSYGMCVLSSKKGDKFNGCIVNTVFQIIPEPPMIAVSVNKSNLTWEYIVDSRVFSVSILSEDTPMPYIGRFGFKSGRDIDKFRGVSYEIGSCGLVIPTEYSVGFIDAEVTEMLDAQTHTLFIGKIVCCENIDSSKTPMTYAYYRDVKHGKTPRSAATYHKEPEKKGTEIMKKYECMLCGYVYDPAAGDPDNGVEAGTVFEQLPDDWVCPVCGAKKDQFEAVD